MKNILFIEKPHNEHLKNIKNYRPFILDAKDVFKKCPPPILENAVDIFCDFIKENEIDFLVPVFNDKYQPLAKKITLKANIHGFSNDICFDKSATYDRLYRSNIFPKLKTLVFNIDTPINEIKNTVEKKLKFPVVIKPNYGSGAMGVSVIKTINKLQFALDRIKEIGVEKFIIQSFVSGKTLYVGGFIANGILYPLITQQREYTKFPHRYIVGCYNINDEKYYDHLTQLAQILNINNTFIDMEFIENESGIYPIDIHARTGGFLFDYFENRGISRIELFLDTLNNPKLYKKPTFNNTLYFKFLYPLKNGYIHKIEQANYTCLARNDIKLALNNKIAPIKNGRCIISRGSMCIISSDIKSAKLEYNKIIKTIEIKTAKPK